MAAASSLIEPAIRCRAECLPNAGRNTPISRYALASGFECRWAAYPKDKREPDASAYRLISRVTQRNRVNHRNVGKLQPLRSYRGWVAGSERFAKARSGTRPQRQRISRRRPASEQREPAIT